MDAKRVKPGKRGGRGATRREFLGAAAAALGTVAVAGSGLGSQPQPTTSPTPPEPWWLRRYHPRSRVVDIRSNNALHASVTDRVVLEEAGDAEAGNQEAGEEKATAGPGVGKASGAR